MKLTPLVPLKVILYTPFYILLSLCAAGAYAQNLRQGLQIHYTLDSSTTDLSGQANDGTAADIIYVADRLGNANGAAFFNGATSLVTSQFPANISQNFTVALWARPVAFPTGNQLVSIAGLEQFDVYMNIGLSGDSTGFQFQCSGLGRQAIVSENLSAYLNQWVHLLALREDTTERLFINGIQTDSATVCTGTVDGIQNRWKIGGSPLIQSAGRNGFFAGDLDDFRLYNRALTQAEIDTLSGRAVAIKGRKNLHEPYSIVGHTIRNHKGQPLEATLYSSEGREVWHVSIEPNGMAQLPAAGGLRLLKVEDKAYFWVRKVLD